MRGTSEHYCIRKAQWFILSLFLAELYVRVSVRERTASGAIRERTRKTTVHRGRANECTRFDEALAFDVETSNAATLALRVELHSLRRPHAILGVFHLASRVCPPAPLPLLVPDGADKQRTDITTTGTSGEESKEQQLWFASSAESRWQWLDVFAQRPRSDTPRWHSVFSEQKTDRVEGDSIWRRARNSLLHRKRATRGDTTDRDISSGAAGEIRVGTDCGEKSASDEGRQASRRASRNFLWPFGSVREHRRRNADAKHGLLNKQMSFQ